MNAKITFQHTFSQIMLHVRYICYPTSWLGVPTFQKFDAQVLSALSAELIMKLELKKKAFEN